MKDTQIKNKDRNREVLRRRIRVLVSGIQEPVKISGKHGEFVDYTYHSPHSPDELTEKILWFVDGYTAREGKPEISYE